MNRNRKLRKQMMSGLAVGMAAVMGAAPVYAATGEDAAVSKEETVYVNANADGSEDQITVSNWLKNAGTEKNLKDESELKDIQKRKGDEEFTQSGNELTWQTDGEISIIRNNQQRTSGFREVHLLSGRQGNQTG